LTKGYVEDLAVVVDENKRWRLANSCTVWVGSWNLKTMGMREGKKLTGDPSSLLSFSLFSDICNICSQKLNLVFCCGIDLWPRSVHAIYIVMLCY
jgi:hypothetical protein